MSVSQDQPMVLRRSGPTGSVMYAALHCKTPVEILWTRHRGNAKIFTSRREADSALQYARGFDLQRQFKFEWVSP